MTISVSDFERLEIRAGTVAGCEVNQKSLNPAYALKIDFGGEIGVKSASARLTALFTPDALIGRRLVCVMNLPPIRIGAVISTVRVLGCDTEEGFVPLSVDEIVADGAKIS